VQEVIDSTMVFWSVFWLIVWLVPYLWRTGQWSELNEQVEELKSELDALHEAFHQSEKAREKAITERENMKRERDEWQTQYEVVLGIRS
jgi:FtsZ-binding cell division protein ZapB